MVSIAGWTREEGLRFKGGDSSLRLLDSPSLSSQQGTKKADHLRGRRGARQELLLCFALGGNWLFSGFLGSFDWCFGFFWHVRCLLFWGLFRGEQKLFEVVKELRKIGFVVWTLAIKFINR
jgi:hypothetical protein